MYFILQMALFSNLQHFLLSKDPTRHLAFPDICQLASGSLLVVFRNGQAHVDLSGQLMLIRCTTPDAALQFEPPQVICNTDWDDRDPSIAQLSDGTIVVNFFRLADKLADMRLTIIRSLDEGHTWTEPYDIPLPEFPMSLATSDAVVEVDPGEIIMPLYGRSEKGEEGSYLVRSFDYGKTWSEISRMAVYEAPIFEEPALCQLPDGRLLGMLRTDHGGVGYIYQTLSTDKGRTWSEPERLDLWGYPADLLLLSTGQVLASYGYRQFPTGVRFCLANSGLQWDIEQEGILRSDGDDGGELGYPSSVELPNGDILTVYYFTDRGGGFPYIAGSRYRFA